MTAEGDKPRPWGEIMKAELLAKIAELAASVHSDSRKGLVIVGLALAGFGAFIINVTRSDARDVAKVTALEVTAPLVNAVPRLESKIDAVQLQVIENQKDTKAISRQMSSRQIPARLERAPVVIEPKPPKPIDGGP